MIARRKKSVPPARPNKPVEPTTMSVNMIYDPGPQADPGLVAARTFVEKVGGIEKAMALLERLKRC